MICSCFSVIFILSCLTLPAAVTPESKDPKPLPIDAAFKLPSPLPSWPQGEGFARGAIDLGGGLLVRQISTFNKVWATHEGGPDNLGATFFEPSSVPQGFSILGFYAQPNNRMLHGWILVAKDEPGVALERPVDYRLLCNTGVAKIKQEGFGYFWEPVPPDGYKAVGLVVTTSPEKPPLDKVRCVRSDLTADQCEPDTSMSIWKTHGFDVLSLRPTNRGILATGVSVGTFTVQNSNPSNKDLPFFGDPPALYCLNNANLDFSPMPNKPQIETLFQTYAPWIYLHPKEQYLPSSVNWYFSNGALLFKQGQELHPTPIHINGSNLPQGGSSDDGLYWLDAPDDEVVRDRLKRGDLEDAMVYLHVKPMLGATFTDIAVWVFYPFNGPARLKVKFLKSIGLGKVGEHTGDWEHVTLRISNFNGELYRVYFSQHSRGAWVDASDLEYQYGNKPAAYASLHGHAMYSKSGAGKEPPGGNGVGMRNDTAKSNLVIHTGRGYEVVAAEYLRVVEPPWLNYMRKWGPKIGYKIQRDLQNVEKALPGLLKKEFRNIVNKLPREVFGEEGPSGPKGKHSWAGDEID